MAGIEVVAGSWRDALFDLVSSARSRLTIVAPFISVEATGMVASALHSDLRASGCVSVFTDLSPRHVQEGALEPEGITRIASAAGSCCVWHVRHLHAKVYIADERRAIVTSGNLTTAALHRNVEVGLSVNNRRLVAALNVALEELKVAGVLVSLDQLKNYILVAARVREEHVRRQDSTDPALQRAYEEAVRTAEDELIRFRLADGAMHTVFAKTILFLLRQRGPMSTERIHIHVKAMHPELCDDSVDRVIDGKRFGKKWKHAVRTAQQQLKRRGLVELTGGKWRSVS